MSTSKRRLSTLVLPLLCLLWLGLLSLPAQAQETAFQLQQYRPLGDPYGMLHTQSGRNLGQWKYLVGVMFNYGNRPLTFRGPNSPDVTPVMDHQFALDIIGGIGFTDWFDLYVSIPMTLYQVGTIPNNNLFPSSIQGNDLSGFAFSDIKVHLKLQALREKKHFLNLAFQAYLGIPSGDTSTMNGEGPITFGVAVLLNKQISIVNIGLNVGYRFLPATQLANLNLNHELFYALGLGFRLARPFEFLLDVSGSTAISETTSVLTSPLELFVGGRIMPLGYRDLSIKFGAAIGLTSGYGAPRLRAIFGVVWAPKEHDKDKDGIVDEQDRCPTVKGPRENQGCPWPDTDGDNLTDNIDKCPKIKGPKENQGCPWPDTDGDGLTDNIDKCPKVKGPKENQGCPWPDTDGDGLTDNIDKCPKIKGPKENQGCPWPDTDGDGLTDNIDKCPKVKGPKENNGCPDTDVDKDGIVDRLDKCKFVKGLPNTEDPSKHGCPKVILVKVTPKEIVILQKIQFRTGSSRILRKSFPILDQVVNVMNSQSKIKVLIEGHTDNIGGKRYNLGLSKRRAASVRRYLIKKGISKDRLQSEGFGMSKPLVSNSSRKNRAKNRRVQFKVITDKTK